MSTRLLANSVGRRFRLSLILIVVLMTCLLALSAAARDITHDFKFDGKELYVSNLIGKVDVVAGQGDEFKVEVIIRGEDAEEGLIEFVTDYEQQGKLVVKFPIDEEDDYVYPELGRKSKTTISFNDGDTGDSWLKKVFKGISGKRITVRGKGRGLEVWADITVSVPKGKFLEMKNGVGQIEAVDVTADLRLDTNSGAITASDIVGDFVADTGSGSVDVQSMTGPVSVDTGSGSVQVKDCEGDKVHVDTGSGSVRAVGIVCQNLHIDTGSGGVKARSIETDRATIDTGSGSVELQLDRMGDGRFIIDTGSGGIELVLPHNASARVQADTGSGRVRHDLDDVSIAFKDRDALSLTVGNGDARVTLDAGSGSINISQR